MTASSTATSARNGRMQLRSERAVTRLALSKLPEILIVQMKRFKYEEKSNRIRKLDCHVSFGQFLSLAVQAAYEGVFRRGSSLSYQVRDHPSWTRHPLRPLHRADLAQLHLVQVQRQRGVGSLDSLQVFDERKLHTIFGGINDHGAAAYIVFYEKVDADRQVNQSFLQKHQKPAPPSQKPSATKVPPSK